jgi:RNA polymerase sigma factor (sigma-70 family)
MPHPVSAASRNAGTPEHGSSRVTSRDRLIPDALTKEEFSTIYIEQFHKVRRFLLASHSYLSAAEAEDVAQDAFLVLMQQLEKDADIRYVPSYLFTVASRLAARRAYHTNREILTGEIPDAFNYTAMDSLEAGDHAFAQQLIEHLPRAQRDTFSLVYAGFTPVEISKMLGVSEATVRSNLRHARKILRERLHTLEQDQ